MILCCNFSQGEFEWLSYLIHSSHPNLKHRFTESGPPIRFGNVNVDGYDEESNTVFLYDVSN